MIKLAKTVGLPNFFKVRFLYYEKYFHVLNIKNIR